ncbi:hypothetical protein FORC36_2115 [Vibrio vulnificus]|nr:hypothetical protein FORC36_2115 [Vibrio vulnificus]
MVMVTCFSFWANSFCCVLHPIKKRQNTQNIVRNILKFKKTHTFAKGIGELLINLNKRLRKKEIMS